MADCEARKRLFEKLALEQWPPKYAYKKHDFNVLKSRPNRPR